jgi:hypothetical protein
MSGGRDTSPRAASGGRLPCPADADPPADAVFAWPLWRGGDFPNVPPALIAAAMIPSVAPALLSASTIAVNLLGTVIGVSPRSPTGSQIAVNLMANAAAGCTAAPRARERHMGRVTALIETEPTPTR